MTLLLKLAENPSSLTNIERKMLRQHPVIANMLKINKKQSGQQNELYFQRKYLYVPIDGFLNPKHMFHRKSSSFQQSDTNFQVANQTADNANNPQDCENMSQDDKKIGLYTIKQRQTKINKYKQKVKNWTKNKRMAKLARYTHQGYLNEFRYPNDGDFDHNQENQDLNIESSTLRSESVEHDATLINELSQDFSK